MGVQINRNLYASIDESIHMYTWKIMFDEQLNGYVDGYLDIQIDKMDFINT